MTTLESLQALPDDQLIGKVAMEVMGWNRDGEGRYVDWENRKWWGQGREWNPLTDWNHTMEVVAKVSAVWEIKKDGMCEVRFGTADWYYQDDDPQRAICLAALLAVQK